MHTAAAMSQCQICLHTISVEGPVYTCPDCRSPYHTECWDELGGCACYGCPRMVEVTKASQGTPAYWGATRKVCPFCALEIAIDARECCHCGSHFEGIRPMTVEDVIPMSPDPNLLEYRRKAAWLLVFSALGFTSPIALVVGTLWYRSQREQISRAGSSARALVVLALAICVIYLVMFGLGTLAFEFGRWRLP